MSLPADRNMDDLKIAWNVMWMIDIFHSPILNRNIINPSCLRVDRAISFFRSVSQHAVVLVINIVSKHRDEIVILFR